MERKLLLFCVCATLVQLLCANEEPNFIVLLGSNSLNDHKRPILQKIYPNTDFDGLFARDLYTPNIHIFNDFNGQFSLLSGDKYLQFHELKSPNSTTLVLALKGCDELSLDELRLLHQLIYRINGGIAVVEIGPSAIQTSSLLGHSSFCWAVGKLRPEFANSLQNTITLCNDVRPSSLRDLLDDDSVVPLNRRIEPTTLPIMPVESRRFWPTMMVSAADSTTDSGKKQRSNKKTTQPNVRHNRVYGKDKKRMDANSADVEADAPIQFTVTDKLDCKYRKSCYAGQDAPPEPAVEIESPNEQAEEDSKHEDDEDLKSADRDAKLKCKYRQSCYSEAGIESKSARPEPKTTKTVDKTPPNEKQNAEKAHEIENSIKAEDKWEDSRLRCKYRKSCYSTGHLDMEAIHATKNQVPIKTVTIEQGRKAEIDKEEFKLNCKYRKSCYESGNLPDLAATPSPLRVGAEKAEQSREKIDLDELNEVERKVQCKYRKSCYESGVLPDLSPSKVQVKVEVVEKDDAEGDQVEGDERAMKVKCKYRKSCYESGAKKSVEEVEEQTRLDDEVQVEEHPVREKEPSILTREESKEKETDQSAEENVEDSMDGEEEPVRESSKTPKKPGRKSAETTSSSSSSEAKKKDPHRFIHKFKTVGKYEKLPKNEPIQEGDEASIDQEEEGQQQEDISMEVVEPIPIQQDPSEEDTGSNVQEEDEEDTVFSHHQEIIPEITPDDQEDGDEEEGGNAEEQQKQDLGSDEEPQKQQTHSLSSDNERDEEEDLPNLSASERLERCKYRKSCYRSGVAPDLEEERKIIAQKPKLGSPPQVESKQQQADAFDKLACKYRKSCYAKFAESGIQFDESEVPQVESKQKQEPSKNFQEEPSDGEEDEHEKENEPNRTIVVVDLSTSDKLDCKYRHSCYTKVQPKKQEFRPKAATPARMGTVQMPIRTKCNKYYLSCREQLGLAPKEHAPMGSNGRRLCRKKKHDVLSD